MQNPSFSIKDRTAIIVGASQGIGRQISISFAKQGADVILSSRREKVLREVSSEINNFGGRSTIIPLNVRKLKEILRFTEEIRERMSQSQSSLVLIYCAGVDLTKPILEVSEKDWNAVFETHLKGLFFVCQGIGGLMIEKGYGKIIIMSSTWSFSTDPGKSVYASAKAGVSHLTSALATEWAEKGVRVNSIAPTATLTPPTIAGIKKNEARGKRILNHIPMGRYAVPDDLLGSVTFLASPASDFITGQTLFVDGGWQAKA